jgi:hypothetical protein
VATAPGVVVRPPWYISPMRLQRFRVSGFKNLRQPVELDRLGPINVIHGENNVGKSNLLQAMDLFFHLLRGQGAMLVQPIPFTLGTGPYPAIEIFNLEAPQPIEMEASFLVGAEDLAAAEMIPPAGVDATDMDIALRIERDNLRSGARSSSISKFRLFDQDVDLRVQPQDLVRLIEHVTRVQLPQEQRTASRYVLIGTDRRVRDAVQPPQGRPSGADKESRNSLIPDPLLLSLYDAKESFEPLRYKRWELFVAVMQEFEDIMGKGTLVATFDRRTNQANLALQTEKARIPISLQGSGVQQLVALLGYLLMSDAAIVAIEEPELNLRFDLQRRLRDALEKITASPAGPTQIFLASHSPAFETGECFYAMRATDSGPIVELRKIEEAPLFTSHALENYLPGGTAPLSYVSSDGLVQVPAPIRKELGLEHGGGVVILKRENAPYVEFLTNEQFLDLMQGGKDAEQENDQE